MVTKIKLIDFFQFHDFELKTSKRSRFIFPNDKEASFINTNSKGNKWLICYSHNPNIIFVSNHSDHIA